MNAILSYRLLQLNFKLMSSSLYTQGSILSRILVAETNVMVIRVHRNGNAFSNSNDGAGHFEVNIRQKNRVLASCVGSRVINRNDIDADHSAPSLRHLLSCSNIKRRSLPDRFLARAEIEGIFANPILHDVPEMHRLRLTVLLQTLYGDLRSTRSKSDVCHSLLVRVRTTQESHELDSAQILRGV